MDKITILFSLASSQGRTRWVRMGDAFWIAEEGEYRIDLLGGFVLAREGEKVTSPYGEGGSLFLPVEGGLAKGATPLQVWGSKIDPEWGDPFEGGPHTPRPIGSAYPAQSGKGYNLLPWEGQELKGVLYLPI